jgi:hypothetical protein
LVNLLHKIPFLAIAVWIGFVVFSYFGEYPPFLVSLFDSVLKLGFIGNFFEFFNQTLLLSNFSPEWLAARCAVAISFLFNYCLIRVLSNNFHAKTYLFISLSFLILSAVASPFGLTDLRAILSSMIRFFSHPAFLLIIIPVRRVYLYYGQIEEKRDTEN